jgi:hypothetical protein
VQPAQQRRSVVPAGLVGAGPGGGHRAVGPGGPADPGATHRCASLRSASPVGSSPARRRCVDWLARKLAHRTPSLELGRRFADALC